jgi:hypothetical protein
LPVLAVCVNDDFADQRPVRSNSPMASPVLGRNCEV